jgi:hypothetical protein
MRRHRHLIMSPLEWQMTAAPVPHSVIPVLAERGGTQLQTPRPMLFWDSREQNPSNFSRCKDGLRESKRKPAHWETTLLLDWKMSAWWSERIFQTWSNLAR